MLLWFDASRTNDALHMRSDSTGGFKAVFEFLSTMLIFQGYFHVAAHKQIHYTSCATGSK